MGMVENPYIVTRSVRSVEKIVFFSPLLSSLVCKVCLLETAFNCFFLIFS